MMRIYHSILPLILPLMIYSIWVWLLAMMRFSPDAATKSPSTIAGVHIFMLIGFLLTQCSIHWGFKRDRKTIQNHQRTKLYTNLDKLALPASWIALGLIAIYIFIFKILPVVF